jgi:outer membrane protein assembly factor BamB
MRQSIAFFALLLSARAQDWPQFLGPTRNGVYNGAFSLKAQPRKIWEKPVGEGFSAPVLAGGRLLIFHRQGGEEILESLDPATAKSQWSFRYATNYRDDFGFSEGPRATPAVEGDRAYIYGAEGALHCVNVTTGKKAWGFDARERFGVGKEFFGTGCSPLVEGDLVLMNIGGRKEAGIVALNKMTGATVWKLTSDEAGYSSPVAATIGGERHALFFTRTGLVDVDPARARIRFQMRWRSRQAASVNAATPLVAGNLVFLSASYDTGAALIEINGDKYREVWSGGDSLSNHYATSVEHQGYLYGFHGRQEFGQSLRCVEMKSGKVMWSQDGFGAGSITMAKDHLFVIRENGELIAAPASPKAFAPAVKMRLANGTVRAYPALAHGRLYVRNDSTLIAHAID